MAWIMPTLGHGSIGPKGMPAPSLVYFDLSTWHRVNFLYTPKFSGSLRELRAFFADPAPYRRLRRVIEHRLGHELLGRTEQAKIELSDAERTLIDLAHVERGLAVPVRQADLLARLDDLLARLVAVGRATVEKRRESNPTASRRSISPAGSSGMSALRSAFGAAFPDSAIAVGDLFGSVVSGLRHRSRAAIRHAVH
jgi:hypothetical chaperone protein